MNWRVVGVGSVTGLFAQFLCFLLFTQHWFQQLLFPKVDGWGFFAASIALVNVFIFVVVPLCVIAASVWTYRHVQDNKWKHFMVSALITVLPAAVLFPLH